MTVQAEALGVGTTRKVVVVDGLTRTQIVQYAGASGDYNPLHTDEIFATKVVGYPSVFAHGMLSMGLTGKLLTDWFGVENVKSYGVRFRQQVWPGDTLVTQATVEAIRETDEGRVVELSLSTTNERGDTVVEGYATALLTEEH